MMDNQTNSVSEARVGSAMARRYLSQLCKHFQHKLPVTLAEDGSQGSIRFQGGTCALAADADALTLRLLAEDAAARERLEDVVARHLLRFAFRENLEVPWQASA